MGPKFGERLSKLFETDQESIPEGLRDGASRVGSGREERAVAFFYGIAHRN